MDIKYYGGSRGLDGCEVFAQPGGVPLPLKLDLREHSPTGFEWGYGGSGPAQLALALLYAVTQDSEIATDLYQEFKWDIVANLPAQWALTPDFIRGWIRGYTRCLLHA